MVFKLWIPADTHMPCDPGEHKTRPCQHARHWAYQRCGRLDVENLDQWNLWGLGFLCLLGSTGVYYGLLGNLVNTKKIPLESRVLFWESEDLIWSILGFWWGLYWGNPRCWGFNVNIYRKPWVQPPKNLWPQSLGLWGRWCQGCDSKAGPPPLLSFSTPAGSLKDEGIVNQLVILMTKIIIMAGFNLRVIFN